MTMTEPNAGTPVADALEPEVLDPGLLIPQQESDAGDPSAAAAGTAHEAAEASLGAKGEVPLRPVPPIVPPIVPPLRLTRRASGTYASASTAGYQLELRVDVDGSRPLHKLSGDYFHTSGGTTSWFGSWTVDAVTTTSSATETVVKGTARTTWSTTHNVVVVTVPKTTILQPAPSATVRWYSPSGAPGATYTCLWRATSFRTVELEQDVESRVDVFTSYDTGSLPSGGPARTLTVAGAYGEAGITMLDTGRTNTLTTPAGHIWNNASLHHAMRTHFSAWRDTPQFKVWLLHAWAHEIGQGLRGIMFDQQGLQRQGCASFYQVINADTPANRREQLYVHVHELGHCFNLFHSFHKEYMDPPRPNRPGALSWMNYPQRYNPGGGAPSGPAAFWSSFPFQFDELELAHLRHGFRNDLIMGGNPFGKGAALEAAEAFRDLVSDTSGIDLRISLSPERPVLGQPVVLMISAEARRGTLVHAREQLHPKYGLVSVAVRRPHGDVVVHRPPLAHCAEPDLVEAGPGQEQPVSAYIGYDAGVGQVFQDPGTYAVRAAYAAPDGSVVLSNVATVRIAAPFDREQDEAAELMLGDDAGMVLTLLGSDSPYLAQGRQALETVREQHAGSPFAVYAQLAEGMSAARPFTEVREDGGLAVRGRDLDRADALLGSAVEASRGRGGLDDLTVLQVLDYLSASHAAEGDDDGARRLRREAVQLAEQKDAPASVVASLRDDPDGAAP